MGLVDGESKRIADVISAATANHGKRRAAIHGVFWIQQQRSSDHDPGLFSAGELVEEVLRKGDDATWVARRMGQGSCPVGGWVAERLNCVWASRDRASWSSAA